jgi:hypothetical protein
MITGLLIRCGPSAKVAVVLPLAAILRNGQLRLKKMFTTSRAAVVTRIFHSWIGTIDELHGNTNRHIFLANVHGI